MKKIEKNFDAVKYMRDQRDILSKILANMSSEEIIEFFKNSKAKTDIKPSAKMVK